MKLTEIHVRLIDLGKYRIHPKSVPAVQKALGDIEDALDVIWHQIEKSAEKTGRGEWDWPEKWPTIGEIET